MMKTLIWYFRDTATTRIVAAFAVGFSLGGVLLAERLADQIPTAFGTTVCLPEWQVRDLPRIRSFPEGRSIRFPARVASGCLDGTRIIDVGWYVHADAELPLIVPGQWSRDDLQLRRTRGWINPGTFDYESWSFSRGFAGRARVRGEPVPVTPSGVVPASVRHHIVTSIEQLFGGSDVLGLMRALAIGDGGDSTPEHWDLLIRSGTIHLIVISGLHLAWSS